MMKLKKKWKKVRLFIDFLIKLIKIYYKYVFILII